jgi:hypothetical protein
MTHGGARGASLGNPEARRIADEALGVFAEVLGPVAEERYLAAYGQTWRKDRGFRSSGFGARTSPLGDPQELLGRLRLSPEFEKVFRPVLHVAAGPVDDLARDLTEQRNTLYHRLRPWEVADAWRGPRTDRHRAATRDSLELTPLDATSNAHEQADRLSTTRASPGVLDGTALA